MPRLRRTLVCITSHNPLRHTALQHARLVHGCLSLSQWTGARDVIKPWRHALLGRSVSRPDIAGSAAMATHAQRESNSIRLVDNINLPASGASLLAPTYLPTYMAYFCNH